VTHESSGGPAGLPPGQRIGRTACASAMMVNGFPVERSHYCSHYPATLVDRTWSQISRMATAEISSKLRTSEGTFVKRFGNSF
jgi:hypothetical protein